MVEQCKTGSMVVPAHRGSAHHDRLGDQYQMLLSRILNAGNGSTSGQSIGITSCASGAGVSTVAINVAMEAAKTDIGPILLIEAKRWQRAFGDEFRVRPDYGLLDALSGRIDPLDCVTASGVANLSLVNVGDEKGHGDLTFEPASVADVFETYQRHFRLLIVDLPESTEFTPCFMMAGHLDGVVLVLEAERADRRVAARAKRQLENIGAQVLGVVFNKRCEHIPQWLYRRL